MHSDELTGLSALLFKDKLLDLKTLLVAKNTAHQHQLLLSTYLVKASILPSDVILQCCAKHFSLPIFDLTEYDTTWLPHPLLTNQLIHRHHVLPLNNEPHNLKIGISDPTNQSALSAIEFHSGVRIEVTLVDEMKLQQIITTHCKPTICYSQLESALSKVVTIEEPSPKHELVKEDEPIMEFSNQLIQDAIDKKASDIHIEPYETRCRIRFRRHGLLYESATIPSHLADRIILRLKMMAQMNIAERRLPQDGRIRLSHSTKLDIRVNTCPTQFGEKMVLRLLDLAQLKLDITALGLTMSQREIFIQKIRQPQGLILVTGPTGSGKTVTLYSALHHLNTMESNISTVEDPIEIELPGVNQINIHPHIGLDFSAVLKTLLRQDPDILMVGEIRDSETARIAMQAAQTGHLVLSTLHTNSAADVVMRLQSLGISPYDIHHTLSLIVTQRLVRVLCERCKEIDTLHSNLDITYFKPIGCQHCWQGYTGRTGIFELLDINEETRQILLSPQADTFTRTQLNNIIHPSLHESAEEKAKAGITSCQELNRVLGVPCHSPPPPSFLPPSLTT